MIVISDNITTRNRKVAAALKPLYDASSGARVAESTRKKTADFLQVLAKQCLAAGADILNINLQQRYDRPEVMEFVINTVQGAVNCQLCLSSNRPDTLERGLQACQRPPIVNYISLDKKRLEETLPLAAQYGAEVVLYIADPFAPASVEDTLKLAAVLAGAANEAGIPNDRIIIDPGVQHVTSEVGQRRLKTLTELLPALVETFDPPVRTTCWVNNISAGAAKRLRPAINSTFLAMFAGLGLSSAFIDVLSQETMRTIRLIKVFRNQRIYSDGDIE
ncbi:MAG TPA: dihydropteroate synthase [Dehalococcoidales bacterium]